MRRANPMKLSVVHHSDYAVALPEGHRFPINKFAALARFLQDAENSHRFAFHAPSAASIADLERAHDPAYVAGVLDLSLDAAAVRRLGFPLTEEVARRARLASAGSLLTGRLALAQGLATHVAGGSHHAHREFGAGFCVFNDVAVAIRTLQAEGAVRRVLVIDCDVHQGDGTAAIFAGDKNVFTLSLHCASNFPVRKAVSDLDVALADGTGDEAYLAALRQAIQQVPDDFCPDLVFYNAGVDVHAHDRLGRLALSDAGIAARERLVIAYCRGQRLPLACVSGGGYGSDVVALARRHALVHLCAAEALAADHHGS